MATPEKSKKAGQLSSSVLALIHAQNRQLWRCATSGIWNDFKKHSIITMHYLSPEVDYTKPENLDGSGSKSKTKWVNDLKIGDIVVIMDKHGYFGLGIIESAYVFKNNDITFSSGDTRPCINVKYIHSLPIPVPHLFPISLTRPQTIYELNGLGFKEITTFQFLERDFPEALKALEDELLQTQSILYPSSHNSQRANMNNNQIMYGPPGTGKTYSSIVKALAILEGENEETLNALERKDVKLKYDQYVDHGRVMFTTFHQSLSYEDFIEGIKPLFDKVNNRMDYPVRPGLFKNICFEAIKSLYYANAEEKEIIDFDYLFNMFIQYLKDTYDESAFPFTTKEGSRLRIGKGEIYPDQIVVYYEWSNSSTQKEPGKTPFKIKKSVLEKMFSGGITSSETILKALLSTYTSYHISPYYAVYKSLYEFINTRLASDNNSQKRISELIEDNVSYEGYLEKLEYIKKKTGFLKKGEPYVLIIDEINRGNVSQIFGELITLLENDKRLGNPESLVVKLPYSRTDFAVPANLYIIGTMNTADRSVEALDTALRRRFVFKEIPPDARVIQKVFEQEFLALCTAFHHLNWDDDAWEEKEKPYKEIIPQDAYLRFKDKIDYTRKPTMSKEEYQQYWDECGIELWSVKIANAINERIAVLLNRDSLIGHSYFLYTYTWEGIKRTIYKNIIPLLQEYFFGDYGKIGLVLGNGFVRIKNDENKRKVVFADFSYDDTDGLQKNVYELVPEHDVNIEQAIKALLNHKSATAV